jgi:hypothetical protein
MKLPPMQNDADTELPPFWSLECDAGGLVAGHGGTVWLLAPSFYL